MTRMVKVRCDSCQLLRINGVVCHETGCPNAWRVRQACRCCGRTFKPRRRGQDVCSRACNREFWGRDCKPYSD